MWFYVQNESPSLPRRSTGSPVKKDSWNSREGSVGQINFLLGEIDLLKKDHQISGASVIAHRSDQQRVNLGFQFIGEKDPTRYTQFRISHDDLKHRVNRLLKNVAGEAKIGGTFRARRRPREVSLSSFIVASSEYL